MDLSELGARIRQRREHQRLRQADLASAVRVSPQAVSKWERGENAPDITVLVPLAQLLDVSVEWLLGGTVAERETFEAAVLVTGVDDFVTRAEQTPPSGLAAWMNGLHLTVTEAVRAFDGIPVKYVGDGFLAFFTGPGMAARATRAALRARALTDPAALRVALHVGEIYLGTIGHPEYATPDILGAAVNTTFMLRSHATRAPSGVLVSEAIATAQDGLRFTPLGDIDLGAQDRPLTVFEPALE